MSASTSLDSLKFLASAGRYLERHGKLYFLNVCLRTDAVIEAEGKQVQDRDKVITLQARKSTEDVNIAWARHFLTNDESDEGPRGFSPPYLSLSETNRWSLV
ncbi:hypothetical protein RRG08_043368 [Elysia crispata]|uniref:Uncharacterized protein n=1 Tax=Elysia crispata TaxID=231223 RepID=A0AAE1DA85_9GAST|nr:hypothetical protein RRG08_043368 [Elysia crispata]